MLPLFLSILPLALSLLTCPRGSYLFENNCVVCPAGYFTLEPGSLSITSCLKLNDYSQITRTTTSTGITSGKFLFAGAGIGTKAVFVGGYTSATSVNEQYDVYDASNNAWTHGVMMSGRAAHSAAAIQEVAVFAGGLDAAGNPLASADWYVGATSSWSRVTNALTIPRWMMGSIGINSIAFFVGGYTGLRSNVVNSVSDIIEYFDGTNWVVHPSKLSTARAVIATASDGKIAAFAGGTTKGWSVIKECLSVVDIYNVATGIWSTTQLSKGRVFMGSTNVGSNLIFAGGNTCATAASHSSVVDIYSTERSIWTTASLPTAIYGLSGTSLGSKAIFAGGSKGSLPVSGVSSGSSYIPSSNQLIVCDFALIPLQCIELPTLSSGRYQGLAVTIQSSDSIFALFAGGKTDETVPITSSVDIIQIPKSSIATIDMTPVPSTSTTTTSTTTTTTTNTTPITITSTTSTTFSTSTTTSTTTKEPVTSTSTSTTSTTTKEPVTSTSTTTSTTTTTENPSEDPYTTEEPSENPEEPSGDPEEPSGDPEEPSDPEEPTTISPRTTKAPASSFSVIEYISSNKEWMIPVISVAGILIIVLCVKVIRRNNDENYNKNNKHIPNNSYSVPTEQKVMHRRFPSKRVIVIPE